jgi:fructokinase
VATTASREGGPGVLVVGEVLVDLLSGRSTGPGAMSLDARFGGSPANVAVGLARLEVPVRFGGRLARAGYGPWLRRHLEEEGVDLQASVVADEACTLAVVAVDSQGLGSYTFYGRDTADWAWRPDELPDPASLAGWTVHTGSLATALMPGAAVLVRWLQRLRSRGDVTVSYDPNVRASLLGEADPVSLVAPVLATAHLVKASADDMAALYPGASFDEIAREWLSPAADAAGPEIVVVTLGERGALAWHRDGRRLRSPGRAVPLVDTVGAGDAFGAGLVSWLWRSGRLSPQGLRSIDDEAFAGSLDWAGRVAALACGRPGANPPRLAELDP